MSSVGYDIGDKSVIWGVRSDGEQKLKIERPELGLHSSMMISSYRGHQSAR